MAAPKASKPTVTTPRAGDAAVALIYGDDDFAVKQRARQLFQQWSTELGGMDHEVVDAQASNSGDALKALARLREALNTLPFFGGGKAIWFQNCNFLSDDRTASAAAVTEGLADLSQLLKEFQWGGNIRLLISAPAVDKRRTLSKTLEKIAAVEVFEAWKIEDKDWVGLAEADAGRTLRTRKKDISDEALGELIQRVGPHRQQLASEIEKLCLYVGDRDPITLDDIVAIVSRNKQARAFALAESVAERNLPKVLRTLDEELWEMKFDRDKSPIGLLYGVISKMRGMLLVQEMIREGWLKPEPDYYRFKNQLERIPAEALPKDKKFNPLAMHPFVLHKALLQAGSYTTAELVRAMGLLLDCNRRLVSSSLEDALVLQQTLVQIVRGDGSTPAPVRSKTGRSA